MTFLGASFCLWLGVSKSCRLVRALLGVLAGDLKPEGVLDEGVVVL